MPAEMGLKDGIQNTINTLTNVTRQLEAKESALMEKDNKLFDQVVRAKQSGQDARAKMLANELAQLRRNKNTIVTSKLAIFRVVQRLETTKDVGEFVATLGPAIAVASAIQKELAVTMPEASSTLSESFQTMSGMMTEAGQLTGSTPDIQLSNEEAEKIISEAQLTAELEAKEKFPEAPTQIRQHEMEEA